MVSDIGHFHPFSSIFMMPIFSRTFFVYQFVVYHREVVSGCLWPKLRGLAGYQLLPADLERASCVTFLRSEMVPRGDAEMPIGLGFYGLSISPYIYIYNNMCLYLIIIYIYTYIYTIIIYIYICFFSQVLQNDLNVPTLVMFVALLLRLFP